MFNRAIRFLVRALTFGRIEFSFTTLGSLLLLVALALGYAGFSSGQNLLLVLMSLLLSFLAVHFALYDLSAGKVRITREVPETLFAGQPFEMRVVLNNRSLCPSVSVSVGEELKGLELLTHAYFPFVGARKQASASYEAVFERRGVYQLKRIYHCSYYPFGLVLQKRFLRKPREVLVYPALRPVALAQGNGEQSGEEGCLHYGWGTELHGFHEYFSGEDSRLIHWPTSARAGRLMVREFEEPRDPEILIEFDDRAPADKSEEFKTAFEEAVSRAASVAVRHLESGHRVGLTCSQADFPALGGPIQFHTLLRFLATVEAGPAAEHTAEKEPRSSMGLVRIPISWRTHLQQKGQ